MWSSLALMTALTLPSAQTGQLKLTNDRATYWFIGAPRPDDKLIPGDAYYLAFDIEGLKTDAQGKAVYSMAMEVVNSQGKLQFKKEDPRDLEAINSLGGSTLPAWAATEVGTDMPAGVYTLKVTVTDKSTKQTQTLEKKFEVLPKAFGLARVQMIYPAQTPIPAPPIGVVGQSLILACGAVGFDRDKTKKQPDLSFEMRVLDEAGKPVLAKPDAGRVYKDVPENLSGVEAPPFYLALNRAGKFTVELKAVDNVSKKESTVKFPITVLEQPKP